MRLSRHQLRRLIEAEVDKMRLPRGPNSRDDADDRDLDDPEPGVYVEAAMAPSPSREAAVAQIARQVLRVETLETRHSDELDFHDIAVWSIREALEAAYDAGARSQKD